MEAKLLRLCGYADNAKTRALVERIKKNYSRFDDVVEALGELERYFMHSNYYLSLQSDTDMINIRCDSLEEDEFISAEAEVVVWANLHDIELEEGANEINILGFKNEER